MAADRSSSPPSEAQRVILPVRAPMAASITPGRPWLILDLREWRLGEAAADPTRARWPRPWTVARHASATSVFSSPSGRRVSPGAPPESRASPARRGWRSRCRIRDAVAIGAGAGPLIRASQDRRRCGVRGRGSSSVFMQTAHSRDHAEKVGDDPVPCRPSCVLGLPRRRLFAALRRDPKFVVHRAGVVVRDTGTIRNALGDHDTLVALRVELVRLEFTHERPVVGDLLDRASVPRPAVAPAASPFRWFKCLAMRSRPHLFRKEPMICPTTESPIASLCTSRTIDLMPPARCACRSASRPDLPRFSSQVARRRFDFTPIPHAPAMRLMTDMRNGLGGEIFRGLPIGHLVGHGNDDDAGVHEVSGSMGLLDLDARREIRSRLSTSR